MFVTQHSCLARRYVPRIEIRMKMVFVEKKNKQNSLLQESKSSRVGWYWIPGVDEP
jgi:hypothetical protein